MKKIRFSAKGSCDNNGIPPEHIRIAGGRFKDEEVTCIALSVNIEPDEEGANSLLIGQIHFTDSSHDSHDIQLPEALPPAVLRGLFLDLEEMFTAREDNREALEIALENELAKRISVCIMLEHPGVLTLHVNLGGAYDQSFEVECPHLESFIIRDEEGASRCPLRAALNGSGAFHGRCLFIYTGQAMPELPEVETLRRQMEASLVGRKILDVEVLFGGRIRPSAKALDGLVGAKFTGFGRRAKLLMLRFSNGFTLVTHLKMTGSYLLKKAGEAPTKHVHVVFRLNGGLDLWFEDVRKFGFLKLVKTAELESELLSKEAYGPEPLEPSFTFKRFKACVLARPSKKIKPLLMDQRCIAGIGNIYADEAVWNGKVHPERTVRSLTEVELKGIYRGAVDSMRGSLRRLGSSADHYRGLDGEKGGNVPHLRVYGREGQPCRRCGTRLKKMWVAQRGATYCPTCQKPPRSAR